MKRYYSILALSLFFVFFYTVQSFPLNSGHVIDKVEYFEDKKRPLLVFKGFFDPSQFLSIQINSGEKMTETLVLIPNSFVNNLLLKEREIKSFTQDSIIRRLAIDENVKRKENGEIDSIVKITISSKNKHLLELDPENSDARQLSFSIQSVKKKLISSFDGIEVLDPQKVNNNFADMENKPRQKMLLHPITALMSYRNFDQINIAVLNASPKLDSAQKLAVMLGRQQKKNIEKKMGMKLKITNISSVNRQTILDKTKIYFHGNFLRAALILAEVLPGEQVLEPFPEGRTVKLSTDVQIYVGKNFE